VSLPPIDLTLGLTCASLTGRVNSGVADGGLMCSWEAAVCSTVSGSLRWEAGRQSVI
jgi:hypothetical protein